MAKTVFSAKCPRWFSLGILEKGKVITLADIFVEKVRESERAALESKKKAQADAKELIDTTKSDGEKRLVLAERDAAKLIAASAKADADYADSLLQQEKENACAEAAVLAINAAPRMDKAVALILQRVGDVWQ